MSFVYGQQSITANGDFSQKRIEINIEKGQHAQVFTIGMNEFPARFA